MADVVRVRQLLELLTGQDVPLETKGIDDLKVFDDAGGLGYSQLNELLLLFGFDRVSHAFFKYLLDGSTTYHAGDGFDSIEELEAGVGAFRTMAILLYGNVKFAFKSLSQDVSLLEDAIHNLQPIDDADFKSRHAPVLPIKLINPADTYLTGYLVEAELKNRLAEDPSDADAIALEQKRRAILGEASENHYAYLASDHLDVYVATSMRQPHEFYAISKLTREIFDDPAVKDLKLRWFDPTQAYCPNRIDKGLAEALMLRRATCTIYLAQESDTLGKDSELASTLAQGKPVIAYVPEASETYVAQHLAAIQASSPDKDTTTILLEQLQLFEPNAAWRDPLVRAWCQAPAEADPAVLHARVAERIRTHYDGRARTLREAHPLAIQVNLATGVANGVLVVRNPADCARLVRGIVTHTLKLELADLNGHTALREEISGCIFRVVTEDAMLTNTFWNFYLDPTE